MGGADRLLDEAYDIGRREYDCLVEGDVDQAEGLAKERGRLIQEALDRRSGEPLDLFVEKLKRLSSLQGALTEEAKRLHASIKADLLRLRQENRRITGYQGATRFTPQASRFLNKRG